MLLLLLLSLYVDTRLKRVHRLTYKDDDHNENMVEPRREVTFQTLRAFRYRENDGNTGNIILV